MSGSVAAAAVVSGGALLAIAATGITLGWGLSVFGGALPPDKARILYAVLGGLGLVVLVMAARLASLRNRVIEVHDHAVLVPKSELSATRITIAFADVRGVAPNETGVLHITHRGGVTKIHPWHFESPKHAREFEACFGQR